MAPLFPFKPPNSPNGVCEPPKGGGLLEEEEVNRSMSFMEAEAGMKGLDWKLFWLERGLATLELARGENTADWEWAGAAPPNIGEVEAAAAVGGCPGLVMSNCA